MTKTWQIQSTDFQHNTRQKAAFVNEDGSAAIGTWNVPIRSGVFELALWVSDRKHIPEALRELADSYEREFTYDTDKPGAGKPEHRWVKDSEELK